MYIYIYIFVYVYLYVYVYVYEYTRSRTYSVCNIPRSSASSPSQKGPKLVLVASTGANGTARVPEVVPAAIPR